MIIVSKKNYDFFSFGLRVSSTGLWALLQEGAMGDSEDRNTATKFNILYLSIIADNEPGKNGCGDGEKLK